MSSTKRKPQSFLDMNAKQEDEDQPISSEDDTDVPEVKKEKQATMTNDERLKDIEERDEFAERVRARDDSNTKRKGDQQSKKMLEEAAKRLKLEKEDRKKIIPKLREESRQVYLKTREEDKLAELEQEIADEEYLFADAKLSTYERERLEQKKRTLEIARQYKKADELEKVDRYYIPSDSKDDKGNKRRDKYAEDIKEKGPNYDQNRFESDRMNSAIMEFGSKDAKERHKAKHKEKEYEYLLDDEISFVKSLRIEGKGQDGKEKKKEVDPAELAKKSIQEVRKSLPIYSYRESLLEAIKENQVHFLKSKKDFIFILSILLILN